MIRCTQASLGEVESILWTKQEELDRPQILGQEICWVLIPVNKIDLCEFSLHYFPNVVETDIYVFRLLFGHGIRGDEY